MLVQKYQNKWVVGIDLSFTTAGVAILKNNVFHQAFEVNFASFIFENAYNNTTNLVNAIKQQLDINTNDIYYFNIEISNFPDSNLTQLFGLYGGMIMGIISDLLDKVEKYFKFFNANAWQLLVPKIKYNTPRYERKILIKGFVFKEFKQNKGIKKIPIDALAIAYLSDKIKNTLEQKEFNQSAKAKLKIKK